MTSSAKNNYPRIDIPREMSELKNGLNELSIPYGQQIIEKFSRYLKVLGFFKNRIHLISNRDYDRIAKRHFLQSLMAYYYLKKCHHVCDIGAGAGFPSIPLKIFYPNLKFLLFESKTKKADFLRNLVQELDLKNVEIVDSRAECYKEKRFDLILIRAAGKIKKLIKTIDNLIESKGCAIFYKSHQVEPEIRAADRELTKRNFQVQIEKLYTPLEKIPVALVILKKL